MSIGEKYKLQDLKCLICFSIFVEPVLLPCRHGFCLGCFNGILQFNTLSCPYCRKRFGTWLRKSTKTNSLVDEKLWEYIKKKYKNIEEKQEKVLKNNFNQSNGEVTKYTTRNLDDISASVTVTKLHQKISNPGEIRKEYETQLNKFRKELEIEKQNELKASSALIVKLLKEESHELRNQKENKTIEETMLVANPGHTPYSLNSTATTKSNLSSQTNLNINGNNCETKSIGVGTLTAKTSTENNTQEKFLSPGQCNLLKSFAVRLNRGAELLKRNVRNAYYAQQQLASSSSSSSLLSSGFFNNELSIVPPTNTHHSPSRNSNSTDSLKLEMCHFKPIRTVPTTPMKRFSAVLIKNPKAKISYRSHPIEIRPPLKSKLLISEITSRKSAFCYVGGGGVGGLSKLSDNKFDTRNQISSLNSEPSTSVLKEKTSQIITRSLRNRNYQINSTNTKISVKEQPQNQQELSNNIINITKSNNSNIKPKRALNCKSKQFIKDNSKRRKTSLPSSTNGNAKEFLSSLKTKNDIKFAKEIINDQKRCDILIKQELLDHEMAKKLQAEYDTEIDCTIRNPRKTRRQIALDEKKQKDLLNNSNDGQQQQQEQQQQQQQQQQPEESEPPMKKICKNNMPVKDLKSKTNLKKSLEITLNNSKNNIETISHNLRRSKRKSAKS